RLRVRDRGIHHRRPARGCRRTAQGDHDVRLLVTGGAGYIGSVVTVQLLEAGHEVIVLDDLSTGHRDAVPDGAAFMQADLRDAGRVLAGADAVLHFAAKALVAESVAH